MKEREHREFIGGCRNPALSVKRNQALISVGRRVANWYCDFVVDFPEAVHVGERYGTTDYTGPSEGLVVAFRNGLRLLLGAGPEPTDASSKIQGVLMQRWLDLAHDPDICIADWTRGGVPFGINAEIPTCGIFPPGGEHSWATLFGGSHLGELLLQPGDNYASCREQPEDTNIYILTGTGA